MRSNSKSGQSKTTQQTRGQGGWEHGSTAPNSTAGLEKLPRLPAVPCKPHRADAEQSPDILVPLPVVLPLQHELLQLLRDPPHELIFVGREKNAVHRAQRQGGTGWRGGPGEGRGH